MKIGVLTSGGDAPGMNAALRTIAVVGAARGHEVVGIRRGYEGLLDGDATPLDLDKVEGVSRYGGTLLGSARSAVFPTPSGQELARQKIAELELDALVVIGGNGSLTGAHLLAGSVDGCRMIGLPASIDNDIGHCGLAIGVDTAVNCIVDACDRISDTARAHRRAFLVEVMGRRCGFLAMRAGIAAEADAILYGEKDPGVDELVGHLRRVLQRCFGPDGYKKRVLIIKSEGVDVPSQLLVERLSEHLAEDAPGVGIRATILGHVVRGGSPTALDRVIAQRLAFAGLMAAESGLSDVMMSWEVPGGFGFETPDPQVRIVPLADVLEETEKLLNGTSEVIKRRMALLDKVEDILFF